MNKLFRKTWKRGFAMMLALAMVLTLIPSYTASAETKTYTATKISAESCCTEDGDSVVSTGGDLRGRLYLPEDYAPAVGDVITVELTSEFGTNIQVQPSNASKYYVGSVMVTTELSSAKKLVTYTIPQAWIDNLGGETGQSLRIKADGSTSGEKIALTVTITHTEPDPIVPPTLSGDTMTEMSWNTEGYGEGEYAPAVSVTGNTVTGLAGTLGTSENGKFRAQALLSENYDVKAGEVITVVYKTNITNLEQVGLATNSNEAMIISASKMKLDGTSDTLTFNVDQAAADAISAGYNQGYDLNIRLKGKVSEGQYFTIESITYEHLDTFVMGAKSMLLGSDQTIAHASINPSNGQVKDGHAMIFTVPEVFGFTFKGWYASKDIDESTHTILNNAEPLGETLVFAYTPEADDVLYAVYDKAEVANKTLKINGEGYTVFVDGEDATSKVSNGSVEVPMGGKVVITATNNAFMEWRNTNGKIVSGNEEYSYVVTSDEEVVMKTNATDDSVLVEFVTLYQQVIAASELATSASIAYPATVPFRLGYTFDGWSVDGTTVVDDGTALSEIAGSAKRVTLKPVYSEVVVDDKAKVQFLVFVNGSKESEELVAVGTTKTVEAPETADGKNFLYWSSDIAGKVVLGYNRNYSVQVGKASGVYAIYGDTAVAPMPVIAMTNVFATDLNTSKKLSFSVTRSIPEGYTVLEHGMLYSKAGKFAKVPSTDAFVLGGENVLKYVQGTTTSNGVFTLHVDVTNVMDKDVAARGYMVVEKDGVKSVCYSDIAYTSYDAEAK